MSLIFCCFRYLLEQWSVEIWMLLLVLMAWTALLLKVSFLLIFIFSFNFHTFVFVNYNLDLLQVTKLAKKVVWQVDFTIKGVQSWSWWTSFDKMPWQLLKKKRNSKMSDQNFKISFLCPHIIIIFFYSYAGILLRSL